ncbi:DUF433 domain-containing protein [Nocardioides carbamazepini]|uniref:DUF433 domain-containing protein n=1 Tax=Nocardioides carbamazepini TaxID=2854259 RepID=UPI00214A2FEC|nr:DUF433 domain-containing protein [Nocardioides carbamazepini]MCR1783117.1 DUF433 domain-containing protein [Nocardioides carbamazepini]
MLDEERLMLRRDVVARLAGVSERKLDYWARTGLVSPTVDRSLSGGRRTRLYDFTDAMTVMVLANLRSQVSLQHVRQIVAHVRTQLFEVTQVAYAIVGGRIFFQTPDGAWSGVDDPGQIVIHEVLDLRPLRARLLTPAREESDHGQVERKRGVRGSKPVIRGTRVPVSTIRSYLDSGASTQEVLAAYPSLTEADVDGVRALASA